MDSAQYWMVVLAGWLAWVLLHVIGMFFARGNGAYYNGFVIHIPTWFSQLMSDEDLRTVRAHEMGHRHHMHPWKNLLLVSLFIPVTRDRIWRQEFEADDYAAELVGPRQVWLMLHRYGSGTLDKTRAIRMALKFAQQSTQYTTPAKLSGS